MEAFNIAKLDTDYGIMRVSGFWNPLTTEIQLQEIAHLTLEGWIDSSFWLTEQNFEKEIAAITESTKTHLLHQSH